MSKKKRVIISLSIWGVLILAFCLFYFQTPSLDTNKIDKLTIVTLPSPPKQKTITKKGDIQKLATYFNSLHLSPRLGISMPAGTTCWIKTSGEVHNISITGHIIQFDKRTFTVNQDISNDIQKLYQSFLYPETYYIPKIEETESDNSGNSLVS